MKKPHVVIIGAGPGGLTAGMILAHRGCKVTIFEKGKRVGGRNAPLEIGEYRFDLGPTFLLQRFTLDQMFRLTGRNSSDYLTFQELDPLYRLYFQDATFDCFSDPTKMEQEITRIFPGNEAGYRQFLTDHKKKLGALFPALVRSYSHWWDLVNTDLLKAAPYLFTGRSLYDGLGKYFDHEYLKLAFTFQSKYLGMSPWKCPEAFSIISYIEHHYGISHVMGGLCKISEAMAQVIEEEEGVIHLNTPVKKVITANGKTTGVELQNGETVFADQVVINADFASAMRDLFPTDTLPKKYQQKALQKKAYSCSTFMIYLGVKKRYETPHHNILFADDYQQNTRDILEGRVSQDMSLYICNPSLLDPTLAPAGKSAIYVLVPVANTQKGNTDWSALAEEYTERVLSRIEQRTTMTDLRQNIEVQKIITPDDWHTNGVYFGAVFNLAHYISQMLYWRPHNQFEGAENTYLVGGGTHPGSGLPTIYESGRISADLICRQYNIPCPPLPTLPDE